MRSRSSETFGYYLRLPKGKAGIDDVPKGEVAGQDLKKPVRCCIIFKGPPADTILVYKACTSAMYMNY